MVTLQLHLQITLLFNHEISVGFYYQNTARIEKSTVPNHGQTDID